MTDTPFTLLNLGSKLLIYFGMAAVIGGGFTLLLSKAHAGLSRFIKRYIFAGTLLVILAIVVNFFAQVGSFAEMGWAGMFDPDYIAILWESPLGSSLVLRFSALGLALLALLFSGQQAAQHDSNQHSLLSMVMLSLGGILLAASFSLLGHTTELNPVLRILLALHVFITLLWIGSLLPLWQACQIISPRPLQQLMHRFGTIAMGLVVVLLVCGAILAYQLVGSFSELIETSYGLLLLVKLALVDAMLAFAAWHKWRLVPQLNNQATANRLQLSIMLESLVGLAILVTTVMLTTVVGPATVH